MNTEQQNESVNVICIKWGNYYSAEYVNKLFSAVSRNFEKYSVNFYCFTDISKNLNPAINVFDIPFLKNGKFAYPKEAGLCDDNLGGLTGKRVIYFDLDSVICGNLDRIIDFMHKDEPYITRDYGRDSDDVGGSNLYSWVVGTLGFVKSYYEENADQVIETYGSASQEYLSAKIIQKFGKLNFFPNEWHLSFKKHCLRKWPVNFFLEARRPTKDALLVNFHGDPKIHDAMNGNWSTRIKIPIHKKLYKFTKATSWISEHWR